MTETHSAKDRQQMAQSSNGLNTAWLGAGDGGGGPRSMDKNLWHNYDVTINTENTKMPDLNVL
jgi:hypothetical protein